MSLSLLPRDIVADGVGVSKAAQACTTCRKQKRRCDKTLPTCGLCSRMGRMCDYSDSQPAPTAEDLTTLQAKLAELENRLNSNSSESPASGKGAGARDPLWASATNRFPPVFLLDIDCYKWASLHVPRPSVDIPLVRQAREPPYPLPRR